MRRKTLLLWTVLLISVAAISGESAGQQAASGGSLVGLWGVEQTLGPWVRGELTLDARGSEWRARIAGYDVAVTRDGPSLSFRLPGDAGQVRAHLDTDRRTITGHWIQPANGPYSSRYASPLVLTAAADKVWRGTVIPLEERISFYVWIRQGGDGLTAVIRNPEFNFFRRRVYRVERQGNRITLAQKGDEIAGSYDAQTGTLSLSLLESAPPLQLTRRKQSEAIGFYPRVPAQSAYVYQPPVPADDGWPTASLSDVGLNEKPLAALITAILNADPDENALPIQSVLVARHGKLVLEEYFYGFDRDRPHDTRSAGKTWATMLVGVAKQQGATISPQTPIEALFPHYKPLAHMDDRKARITLRDLMTMTSGLACDDSDDHSPGQEDTMQSQTAQPDWYRYTLDLPMAREPGGDRAVYCSGSMNLVGGAVSQATGKWLPDLFQQYFAQPLRISEYHLNLMPTGEAYMGGGLYMRPRDLLKLGQLYLDGGVWKGHRVVSQEWARDSVERQSQLDDPLGKEHLYGFAWHIYHFDVGGRVYTMYFAGGNGGQQIMVLPELDMVVNVNGGAYGEGQKFFRWQALLVPQYIIPAALNAGAASAN